jgi:hypothetical protein
VLEEEVLRREGEKKIAQQKKNFWKDTLLHLIKMHFLGKVKSIKKVDFKKWMSYNSILSQLFLYTTLHIQKMKVIDVEFL